MLSSIQRLLRENLVIQFFLWGYLVFICTSWGVLQLPFCQKTVVSSLDTLFIAASAISTTGLATVDIEKTFSFVGQGAILLMIQLGGIAHIVFASFIILNFEERRAAFRAKMPSSPLSLSRGYTTRELVKKTVAYTFFCEVLGVMMLYLFFKMEGVEDSFWHAIFHSVSAFCAAGFSPFPSNLEQYIGHFGINMTISCLSILGAFGFFLWSDFFKKTVVIKVFSSIVRSFISLMILVGTALFILTTASAASIMAAFFQTVSAITTVGFNTIEMKSALPSTLILLMFLMLFGAAIALGAMNRNTSLATFKRLVKGFFNQKKTVRLRSRRAFIKRVQITLSPVNKYIVVLSIITLILGVTEKEPLLFLLFEAGSALCTVGFNTGVTAELTLFGKGLIIFLMLTGRAGILVLSFAEAIKKVALGELSGTIQSQSLIK